MILEIKNYLSAIEHIDEDSIASCSMNLLFHAVNKIPLNESVFMYDSEAWSDLWCEARDLFKAGLYTPINENEQLILERLKTGTKAVYREDGKVKTVVLDTPKRLRGENKAMVVYRDSGRKDDDGNIIAKTVKFGDPNLSIKNHDPEAAKSFRARHKCSEKNDPDKAGWWSCNIHRFAKQLGLKSDNPW